MQVGFIGLGNVGGKLAGSLLRHGHDLTVIDLSEGGHGSLHCLGSNQGFNAEGNG